MGFLGEMGKLAGGGAQQSSLLENVLGMLGNPQAGGLAGLLQAFKDKGLGDHVASWVGTGRNLPVSADQVHQALGAEQLQALAAKVGLSKEQVSGLIANLLPEVVDKLTPNGTVPEGIVLAQGLNLLKSKFLTG